MNDNLRIMVRAIVLELLLKPVDHYTPDALRKLRELERLYEADLRQRRESLH